MRADEWMVQCLIKMGNTDVFGIPGVVIMDFLYALDRNSHKITPHLCYHEQGAAFAAVGYAQSTGKIGVAYSTRGPGLTNMITAIADAYYDSVPTLFITAHADQTLSDDMRVKTNQEIDTVSLVKKVTKRAVRIDRIEDLRSEFSLACKLAMQDRKGPVFLDILKGLFSQDVSWDYDFAKDDEGQSDIVENTVDEIAEMVRVAKRPVLLIGNGVRGGNCKDNLDEISKKYNIPIISSRTGQDIIPESDYYYGFVGSRATRHSNFILSKADLIVALGNRMAFPEQSKSFAPIVANANIIRVDIDEAEFARAVPNTKNYLCDAGLVISGLVNADLEYDGSAEWLNVCNILRTKLDGYDGENVISCVMKIMDEADSESPFVCDVGNHSFWATTAYAYSKRHNRIMYSGSFGTLGSAFPKAIGAYYAALKPVICFTGDQGVQFNIQELQYIAKNRIPITVVIINNASSGMIKEREEALHGSYFVHTTLDSGYSYPNFKQLAECYNLKYKLVDVDSLGVNKILDDANEPQIIELKVDEGTQLYPSLPVGKPCQDMSPFLPRELYNYLNDL